MSGNESENYVEKYVALGNDDVEGSNVIVCTAIDPQQGDMSSEMAIYSASQFSEIASGGNWQNGSPLDVFGNAQVAFDGGATFYEESVYAYWMDEDGFSDFKGWQIIVNLVPPHIDGVINDDGNVNVLDIVLIIQYILGEQEFNNTQFAAGDWNADGDVNILDIVLIADYLLN